MEFNEMKWNSMISEADFLSLMTIVDPNNGNETKSDLFPRKILKPDITSLSISKK